MNLSTLPRYRATITVYTILILLVLTTAMFSDVFLKARNMQAILQGATSVGIAAIGQTFTILVGGIDLSVGSVVSLTTCLTAGIINGNGNLVIPVLGMVFLLSLFIGFCNGILVTKIGVNPIIVTLGMMAIIQGATLLYAHEPVGAVPDAFYFLAWGNVGFVSFPCIILGVVAATGIVILKRTTFGRYIYATGGNEEASRLSGIMTARIKISAYMICSLCAAITGIYMVSRTGQGDPIIGEPFMFDSIIPVLLGGTAFSGGKGGIIGTIGGVFVLMLLNNSLNLFNVSSYWQLVVSGSIMLIAVVVYARRGV